MEEVISKQGKRSELDGVIEDIQDARAEAFVESSCSRPRPGTSSSESAGSAMSESIGRASGAHALGGTAQHASLLVARYV